MFCVRRLAIDNETSNTDTTKAASSAGHRMVLLQLSYGAEFLTREGALHLAKSLFPRTHGVVQSSRWNPLLQSKAGDESQRVDNFGES